jgi:hypothetical protein
LDERNHQSIGSTKRLKNEQQRPVWPDWAKFRLLGLLFTLVQIYWKLQK